MEGKVPSHDVDRRIAELAERQHGVVALRQLIAMGITGKVIESRLKRHRLHRMHRGAYAVGHRILAPDGRRMAAVLAAGPDAVLSHYSAAELWALRVSSRRYEVTVPRDVRLPAIQCHRAKLPPDEVTAVRGIPVTTVSRTILDVAATSPEREVARLIHEAEVKQLWDAVPVAELLTRYPRRSGTKSVRRALADRQMGGVPKNVFEDAFLAFVERHGLPRPETNVWLTAGEHMYEVDCLWRRPGLIVELDGRGAHDTPRAFERDREKDRRLRVAGWNPIRVTWRQLQSDERELARDLAALTT